MSRFYWWQKTSTHAWRNYRAEYAGIGIWDKENISEIGIKDSGSCVKRWNLSQPALN